ncbi:MAG: hypothetical protein LBJ00_05230 [Planctomycetaceae bacterium]|nr:hypothetical protein [Planctomycetaceae bacterium]
MPLKTIPKSLWAAGFALEQSLRDATLACSASVMLKQPEYNQQTASKNKSMFHLLSCAFLLSSVISDFFARYPNR